MKRVVLFRRLSLGVIDQFVSSGANFLATLFAARMLTVADFGSLSVAVVTFMFAVNITRALCSEAMLIRPGDTPTERRERTSRACGSAILVGLVGSALFAVGGVLTSGSISKCLFVFAGVLPFLLVQDTLRFAAFARADPGAALLSDSIWAIGQIACFAAIALFATASSPLILLGWTLPGVVAAGVHLSRYGVQLSVRAPWSWIVENRDLSVAYALDFLGSQGAGQLGIYVLAGVVGVTAVAGVRGSQTLFGLLNVLYSGTLSVLVPEGKRLAARSMQALHRMCFVSSAVFSTIAAAATGAFLLMPDEVGEGVLGSTWQPSKELIVPAGLAVAGSGILAGLRAGIRATAGASELLRARVYTTPGVVAFPAIGAVAGGAMGASIGIAVSVWWNIVWYVRAYRQSADRYLSERDAALVTAATTDPTTPVV